MRDAVEEALDLLDKGEARVAEKIDGQWVVHQWLKKAILLSFRLNDPQKVDGGPEGGAWFDKVPTKFAHWKAKDFKEAGFRVVPGAIVRRSAYIAPGAVLMPSFVNLGAAWSIAAPWSTPGRRSGPARRSARTCISPAAQASAACSSRSRRTR